MMTTCLICNTENPALNHRCLKCGTVNGSGASACSRLPDPEGKHLEICRLQLATTVMERDQARDKIKRAANALKHHHMARPGIAAIVQLLTENVNVLARGESAASITPKPQ